MRKVMENYGKDKRRNRFDNKFVLIKKYSIYLFIVNLYCKKKKII